MAANKGKPRVQRGTNLPGCTEIFVVRDRNSGTSWKEWTDVFASTERSEAEGFVDNSARGRGYKRLVINRSLVTKINGAFHRVNVIAMKIPIRGLQKVPNGNNSGVPAEEVKHRDDESPGGGLSPGESGSVAGETAAS